jgi:hypothetical protein
MLQTGVCAGQSVSARRIKIDNQIPDISANWGRRERHFRRSEA